MIQAEGVIRGGVLRSYRVMLHAWRDTAEQNSDPYRGVTKPGKVQDLILARRKRKNERRRSEWRSKAAQRVAVFQPISNCRFG